MKWCPSVMRIFRTGVAIVAGKCVAKVAAASVTLKRREGYPADAFHANNVVARIILPEGLELIEGALTWEGDIHGNEVVEFLVKVKAAKEGEWMVEAEAHTHDFPPHDFLADNERFYILVLDDRVLISERKFALIKPPEP